MDYITTQTARERGYEVSRGDYTSGNDNLLRRWYWQLASGPVARFGCGHPTKRAALVSLTQHLANLDALINAETR